MKTSCVVCKDMSQCSRCQIKDLQKQVETLSYALSYFQKESNQQLRLVKDYSTNFELDNKFLPIKFYGEMSTYQFTTITFDPNKFGLFNQPSDEKNYIFKSIYKAIKDKYISQVCGCFELQKKSGTIHAHFICKTDNTCKEIEDRCRSDFTDDPRNKFAIKSYPLQKDRCIDYLKKESLEFYRYDLVTGLDDGLGDPSEQEDCKSKCMGSLKDIFNAIKIIDDSNKHSIMIFIKRLIKKYEITDITADAVYDIYQRNNIKHQVVNNAK